MDSGGNGNSIGRLTEDLVQSQSRRATVEDVKTIMQACPGALERVTSRAVAEIVKSPRHETIEMIVAACFAVGWRCRESLMEADELERIVR